MFRSWKGDLQISVLFICIHVCPREFIYCAFGFLIKKINKLNLMVLIDLIRTLSTFLVMIATQTFLLNFSLSNQ